MAETRLCPVCKEIMKPCGYSVEKKNGTRGLANEIFTYDGVGIIGKLVVCNKCGCLAVVAK